MEIIDRKSRLWTYLVPEIKELIVDGEVVLDFVQKYKDVEKVSDFSFLVFPFAKAYEGFLKRFLLDTGQIHIEDYYSDDIRIGRILNPKFSKESSNVFKRICDHSREGTKVSYKLWEVWKIGRNQVFHYFPHNFRKLDYDEAFSIVNRMIDAMDSAVSHCKVTISSD